MMESTLDRFGQMQRSGGDKRDRKNSASRKFAVLLLFLLTFVPVAFAANNPGTPFLTPLRAAGFSLIPAPQQVKMGPGNVVVDGTWGVVSEVDRSDVAFTRLVRGAAELHGLTLNATSNKKIRLKIQPQTVAGTDDPELNKQGYLLSISQNGVEITGNDTSGLFYGVQSLLQLLRRNPAAQLVLPESEIRDWPSLQLRFVHWDTKHHQKRMETLKRLIDWHAFFKVNMIAFEMEDKYEYPSNPIIGAPGAYTKAEMQELTEYAMARHIQLVPNVQSPAHMNYVLKHKEFEHLKSDGSNYQACMCDPEAIDLIFDMYQDMIDATPGVDYFLVSSDEVYYAGICGKCKDPYNEENRSLAWTKFAVKAHDWMAKRNRRMIAWVEYPLKAKDIERLPPDIINGVMGSDEEFLAAQRKIGMRQLAYSSTQGSELLFPNHFSSTDYQGNERQGRLDDISHTVVNGMAAGGNPIGTFAAAWDDAGLHEETFHLGWATVAQYGWTPGVPTVEQNTADFMDVFYGPGSPDMKPVYDALIEGARFFERGWDRVTSKERETGYGNSYGKGIGAKRTDEVLALPKIPAAGSLRIDSKFHDQYGPLIAAAETIKAKNEDLRYKLSSYTGKVARNRYNLEVFLSIANLENYFIKTVLTLNKVEELLLKAGTEASEDQHSNAVAHLVEASNKMTDLIDWGNWMWQNLEDTWEKSRFKKNRSVAGRNFTHVMDDVKDHFADRREGLDYMIAPFQRMDLNGWRTRLDERIKRFAVGHNVQIKGLKEVRLED